ncbi:hypothetical protein HDV05_007976 [Chytridiales sp. JEL 0842]|nr:hypothetical protein HDV05_007976 [Chytridiales sp. JEL 0842]
MSTNNSAYNLSGNGGQTRSREERLKELERERALFASSRAGGGPSSSSSAPAPAQKPTSSQAAPSAQPLDETRVRKESPDDVCFASSSIRNRVRVGANGKHTFADDEVEKMIDRDLALGGKEWKEWQREREMREREMRDNEKEKELLRKELELTKRERELERERERERAAATTSTSSLRDRPTSSSTKSLSSSGNGKGKEPVEAAKKKPAVSHDAWKQVIAKESKIRSKFHTSDKTLLGLLEEERSKNIQLEAEYQKLMSEVQDLQTNHLQELKNQERKHDTDYRNLQKALILKSEECTLSSRELQQFQARYAKESTGWIAANERLENQMERLGKDLEEAETRYLEMGKQVQDLNKSRKDLAERLTQKENELADLANKAREKEINWITEKEARMKLEVQALQLDHFVTQRDEEIKNIRMQLTKKSIEAEEGFKAKEALALAKKEVAQLDKREKLYMEELDAGAARERQMQQEIDTLKGFQKKLAQELDRLTQKEASQTKDIEQMRKLESSLRQELAESYSKSTQQSDEISILNQEARSLQLEIARLNQEINDLRITKDNLNQQVKQKDAEIASLQALELQLRVDKEKLATEKANAQVYAQDLQGQNQELANRLEAETQSKAEMRQQHKEKLMAVADKIGELQQTLTETQQQLAEFREMEDTLRNVIRQRDETIAVLQRRLLEQQQSLIDTQGELAKESFLNDQMKSKKKEEMLVVQEKFAMAKSAMEDELQSMKSQLAQKSAQLSSTVDELNRLKIEVSTLTADRFRFEARIAELTAIESGYIRQVGTLKEQVKRRDQEVSTLMVKHHSLLDQVKRFDSELQMPSFGSQGEQAGDGSRNVPGLASIPKAPSSASLNRNYSGSSLPTTGAASTQEKPSEPINPFTYRRDNSDLNSNINNPPPTRSTQFEQIFSGLEDSDLSGSLTGVPTRSAPSYSYFKSQKSAGELTLDQPRMVPGYGSRSQEMQNQQQQQQQQYQSQQQAAIPSVNVKQ